MGEIIKNLAKHKPKEATSQWLKLKEGTTTLRALSHSYHFDSHYIRSEKKSYDCTGDVSTCKYCQEGDRARGRWGYVVLVRGDNPEWKVAEFGWSIFETILELGKDKDYGDPRTYDLKITRKGTGKDTRYTVIPGKDKAFVKVEETLLVVEGLDSVEKATDKLMTFYTRKESDGEAAESLTDTDRKE